MAHGISIDSGLDPLIDQTMHRRASSCGSYVENLPSARLGGKSPGRFAGHRPDRNEKTFGVQQVVGVGFSGRFHTPSVIQRNILEHPG